MDIKFNDTEDYQNETLEEYLLRVKGPKHLPLNVVLPITVVYVMIFVTGVVGNISVCVVIIRNVSLHTATNYYLFSLAVSDLTLLLLGLPNDLSVYWQQYPWIFGEDLCKLRALVSEMTSYTSVLTIVAFSMERYLAICHPLHSYAMSGLRRALRIVAALWIIGFVSATPFAVYTTVHYEEYPPGSGKLASESAFCAMLEHDLPPNCPIYELSFLLFFLVPMLVIIVLYGCIGLRIRRRSQHSLGKRVEGVIHGESKHTKTRKSIIRMLDLWDLACGENPKIVFYYFEMDGRRFYTYSLIFASLTTALPAVVVAFFLCWAPFHAQRLLYLYARDAPYYSEINEWMYYIAGCFYYFSSTINPILYNLMSVKYRLAFRQTLCGFSRYERNRSHSSFRETIIQANENSHWRRSLTWRQTSRKSIKSNGTDVVVMIAPITSNENSRRASVNWRKTFLRVTMGSKLAKNTSSDRCPGSIDENDVSSPRSKVSIQVETCI